MADRSTLRHCGGSVIKLKVGDGDLQLSFHGCHTADTEQAGAGVASVRSLPLGCIAVLTATAVSTLWRRDEHHKDNDSKNNSAGVHHQRRQRDSPSDFLFPLSSASCSIVPGISTRGVWQIPCCPSCRLVVTRHSACSNAMRWSELDPLAMLAPAVTRLPTTVSVCKRQKQGSH